MSSRRVSRPSSAPLKLETILRHVRRGSATYLTKLLGEWPEQVDENVAATEALLSLLTASQLSKESHQAGDYELAKACIMGIQWTMQVSGQNARRLDQAHQDKISSMLVAGLDGILLWMDTWARGCRGFAEENEDFLPSSHVLVAHIAATCSQLSCFSHTVGHAMRASPLAASVIASLWTWTDPKTDQPLFMVDLRKDGYDCGCAIIDAVVVYVHDSKGATRAFLKALSNTSSTTLDEATADYFVRLGIVRLRLMRERCRNLKRGIHFVGHTLTWLTEAYTDFIQAEEPNLISALHNQGFLRELIFTIKCVANLLWGKRESTPSRMTPVGVQLIAKQLPPWARKAFSSSSAMCQIIQGGLLSLLLETLAFVQMSGTTGPEKDVDSEYKSTCRAIAIWINGFAFYPSVVRAVSHVLAAKLDKEMLQGVLKMKSHWTTEVWLSVQHMFEERHSLLLTLEEGPPPAFCDNGDHVPANNSLDRSRVCSRCHSAMYCSETCQKEDWVECHRGECEELSEVYASLKLQRGWTHSSTRRFLLAIVQSAFRATLDGAMEVRREKFPDVSPQDLVYVLNFVFPPYCTDDAIKKPTLLDLPGYFKLLNERESLRPMGYERTNRLLKDFQAEDDVIIVQGLFLYRADMLHVLTRVRLSKDGSGMNPDLAVVVGGFTYQSTIGPTDLDKLYRSK